MSARPQPTPVLVFLRDGTKLIGLAPDPEPVTNPVLTLRTPALLGFVNVPIQTAMGQQGVGQMPLLYVLQDLELVIPHESIVAMSRGPAPFFEDYLTRTAKGRLIE